MKILENGLQFNGDLRERPSTKRIVIHHSASGLSTTTQDIHRWHQNRGWVGIGYHYVMYPDGTVVRGRPEWAQGAHAYQDSKHEANTDGIGVCLIGNFETSNPTEGQIESLAGLIQDIWLRYPGIPIIGHKAVQPTACPGRNFPWSELKKRLEENQMPEVPAWKTQLMQEAGKAGLIDPKMKHDPDEPVTKWFVLAVCLNLLKAVRGGK